MRRFPVDVETFKRIWLLALLPALLAVPGAPAWAYQTSQPTVAMTARGGFGGDGSYIIGEWFPVRVSLVNPTGAPSMRVRVEVDSTGPSGIMDVTGTYAREVDLPSPSHKEVTLYTYATGFNRTLDVRLRRGSTIVKVQQIKLDPLEQVSSLLVGVVSSDASLLNALKGEKAGHLAAQYYSRYASGGYSGNPGSSGGASVSVAHMALEEIPALSPALNALGVLVLDSPDAGTLTGEQVSAIRAWVAQGGMLIAASRPDAPELSPELARILPVEPGAGTRNLSSLDSLGSLVAQPLTLTSPVLVNDAAPRTGEPAGARVLAQQDGVPLVAVRELGKGHVAYLALSPSVAPLRNWDGLVPLFKRLIVEHGLGPSQGAQISGQGYYPGYGANGGLFDTFGNLFDLPSLDLPDPLVISLFLIVYIVIVGPLNFIVLRRMGRPELAWATIPALVLVFSVGAYLLGYQTKGGDLIMIRGNVAHSSPGVEETTGMQMWGLYSPVRGDYRIEVGADSVVSSLDRYGVNGSNGDATRVMGGSTTTVENVILNTFSFKGFVAENTFKAQAPLESDLRLGDNMIVGTVRNRSGNGLQDVALVRGDAVQYIGYIAPGSSVQVKLPISSRPFDNSSPTTLLPTPSGVVYASSGAYYPGSGPESDAQREYNRKVQLLSMGLQTRIANEPPTGMDVLAVAWGADVPVNINVAGHIARTEELSLWTSRLPVTAGSDTPRLKAGSVPLWTYMPNNGDQTWIAGSPSGNLNSYADMHFRLPAGTNPQNLELRYVNTLMSAANVDLLAYNVSTGAWDNLGRMGENGGPMSLPNPADYTSQTGHVTLRLQSDSSSLGIGNPSLDLVLNGGQ